MKINRKHFFDNYRSKYGKLSPAKVKALDFLISKLETCRFKLETQMAYILATIFHETNGTFEPVIEGYWLKSNRKNKLYNYYLANNHKALKSIFPNGVNGLTYEGRGFVQLTHDYNYEAFGLKDNPDSAMDPETAFMVIEKGLANGTFGHKLQSHVNEVKTDYVNARRCVNGTDKAKLIAGYAEQFAKWLVLVNESLAMQGYNQEEYIS
jgi:predicted chitinase